jgi:hypothetical protein
MTFFSEMIFGMAGIGVSTFFVDDSLIISVVISTDYLGFGSFDIGPPFGVALDYRTNEGITIGLFGFGVHL